MRESIHATHSVLRFLALVVSLFLTLPTLAAIDPDEFESAEQRERYQYFIDDLRCPKCQNQSLSGSDAPIAADLRKELRRLLKEGESDQQIIDFMVSRYGEFILYKPRFDKNTAVLWLVPAVLLALGATVVGRIVWRHRRRAQANLNAADIPLDAEEQRRLAALLDAAGAATGKEKRA